MYTYDPTEVMVIIGTAPVSGFADGTFVSFEMNNDAYSEMTGADGQLSRSKTNDRTGTLTLTLAMTSPSNDSLSGYALSDYASNSGIFPVTIKWGSTVIFSPSAYVKKIPTVEFSKDINERAWMIIMANCDVILGGVANSDNDNDDGLFDLF